MLGAASERPISVVQASVRLHATGCCVLRIPRKAFISSGQEEVPGSTMYPTLWRADYWAPYLKVPAQHFTLVPLIFGYVDTRVISVPRSRGNV